jgi:ATP-dependent DNA helicase RecQ
VDLEQTLRAQFGLVRFRAGQREVIEQVLDGRDVLCVMPTGGGKSLCYQLPALLLPGVTLVISPLIALMKDQVDALNQRKLSATFINSTLDLAEQRARMSEVEAGRHRLVYVAPERFRNPRFLAMMARLRPSLMAIDEAHCISEWGHDFRPDYARLGLARRKLGSPPCIALTATATDQVRRDIADQLGLREPELFVTGFDRPNLRYAVVEAGRDQDKLEELARALNQNQGPAIVYASSRARCETVAGYLTDELRRETVVYHAGLSREQRTSAQERFMTGDAQVVVATNAFGMGVDKADIRTVVHFNMPGTIEAYYQEAGRAGRDGQPALCLMVYSYSDRFLQELFIDNEYPPRAAIDQIYEFLRRLEDDPIEMTHSEIRAAACVDLNESAVGAVLKILDKFEAIEKFAPRENMAIVRINIEADESGASPSLVDRLGPQASVQRTVLQGLEGLVRDRLGEPVYFRPDELARSLGVDRSALTRAIHALTAFLPIDYVPPFRGNAIRVLDRTRKARDLQIDFAALEKRKQYEYAKLERMIEYCRSRHCRRSYILKYFGERASRTARCGGCDNCRPEQGLKISGRAAADEPIDTPSGKELVLKILSGIARAKGRAGKIAVAQMLTGSDSERMAKSKLDQLSTYGILKDSGFTRKEVTEIIEALAAAGLAEAREVDRFRPVVTLSEEGWQWLKQTDRPDLVLDLPVELLRRLRCAATSTPAREPAQSVTPQRSTASAPESSDESSTAALRETLRSLRQAWAREAGQPPYVIFTNETLEVLVSQRPTTPAALARVKGLGPARIERLGSALLQAIAGSPLKKGAPTPAEITRLRAPHSDSTTVSTEEWTVRLIDRGFTVAEAALIRGLERSTIISHLMRMAHRGQSVPIEKLLSPETAASWKMWQSTHRATSPPPEPADLIDLWPLFLACRTTE